MPSINLIADSFTIASSALNIAIPLLTHADYNAIANKVHAKFVDEGYVPTAILEVWQRLGLDAANPVTNRDDGGFGVASIDVRGNFSNGNLTQTRQ